MRLALFYLCLLNTGLLYMAINPKDNCQAMLIDLAYVSPDFICFDVYNRCDYVCGAVDSCQIKGYKQYTLT